MRRAKPRGHDQTPVVRSRQSPPSTAISERTRPLRSASATRSGRDPGEEPKLHPFGQLKRVSKQWLDNCLEVPYRYGSESRRYIPDFIVVVDDGRGEDDPLHLIVEIKGYRREGAKEKKSTMETRWFLA